LIAPFILLFLAKPTGKSLICGIPFVIVGEVIRLWASGYLTKLSAIVTAGPFALCRNPIYIGTFFISLGYCVISNRLDLLIIGMLLFWLFHGGAIVYEERLLRAKFGQEYEDYCESVPRLIPRLRRKPGSGSFSIQQIIYNNEFRGAASTLLMMGLLVLKATRFN